MSNRVLGALCCVFAGILSLYAIPTWVSAPSNVSRIVLSPTFWPYIITGLIGLSGLYLLVFEHQSETHGDSTDVSENPVKSCLRLVLMAVLMALFLSVVETTGLVIGSMFLFVLVTYIATQKLSTRVVVIGVILPLALYGFFAHVASVAVPQGEWIQLP